MLNRKLHCNLLTAKFKSSQRKVRTVEVDKCTTYNTCWVHTSFENVPTRYHTDIFSICYYCNEKIRYLFLFGHPVYSYIRYVCICCE